MIKENEIWRLMKAYNAQEWEDMGNKFKDYVGLCINMKDHDYRYIIPFNDESLWLSDNGETSMLLYSVNNVAITVKPFDNAINGVEIENVMPISKRDLTPEELYNLFDDYAFVFDDTEKFQKFYGLMEKHEDETEPPYFIQKENLMMKIGHLKEELAEIEKAAENGDLAEFADGIIDLIYVASGLGNLCRLPMNALWNDVQNSNMVGKERVKSLENATKRGSTFDVRKTPNWVAPRGAEIIEIAAKKRTKRKNEH